MSPFGRLPKRTSSLHVAVAIAFALVTVGVAVFTTPDPLLLAALALLELYLVANCFNTVREHELHPLASMLWMTVMFALSYLTAEFPAAFPLVFAALSFLGFGIELYNYRHGTSYLRFD